MPPISGVRPRFLPDFPFPPYSYVPGRFPHPVSDPAGHLYGKPPDLPPSPDPHRWRECRAYLRGVDLFNFGYYWEAHEVWEGLWRVCGCKGLPADFFRGLIKLAAAGVKARQGVPAGVASHAGRAAAILRGIVRDHYFGLSIRDLLAYSLVIEAMAPFIKGDREDDVKIVFAFVLLPETRNAAYRGCD